MISFIFFFSSLLCTLAQAHDSSLPGVTYETATPEPYVLYGEDNRTEVSESKFESVKELAAVTVALFEKKSLTRRNDVFVARAKSAGAEFELCSSERYGDQPTIGFCSGVLVGSDLILTAAHCVPDLDSCKNTWFAFDYLIDRVNDLEATFKQSSVYSCRSVVTANRADHGEYALVRLDRVVEGRKPAKIRSGPLNASSSLIMIGSPLGLPLKVDGPTRISKKNNFGFYVDTDSYDGNSGSPLFNKNTAELEGILIGGEDDFEWQGLHSNAAVCRVSRVCHENQCSGEEATDASRFSQVVELARRNVSVSSQLLNARARTGSISPR